MTKSSERPAAKQDHLLFEQEGIRLFITEEEFIEGIRRSLNDPRPDISSEEMRQFLDDLYKED